MPEAGRRATRYGRHDERIIYYLSEHSEVCRWPRGLKDPPPPTASGRVTLATVHASRGLERRCVRVVGFQEELFRMPAVSGGGPRGGRLAYLATTRACEELGVVVTHADGSAMDELEISLRPLGRRRAATAAETDEGRVS